MYKRQLYANQLSQILDTMEGLQQIDTEGVAPLAHVLPIENVLREDEVGECFTQETVLANAPEQADGMFQVPDVYKRQLLPSRFVQACRMAAG